MITVALFSQVLVTRRGHVRWFLNFAHSGGFAVKLDEPVSAFGKKPIPCPGLYRNVRIFPIPQMGMRR